MKKLLAIFMLAFIAASIATFNFDRPVAAYDDNCMNGTMTDRNPSWKTVSWFGQSDSNLNSNMATQEDFVAWRYFVLNGSYGSQLQYRLDSGSFQSAVYPCGAIYISNLNEGVHTLRVEQNLGSSFGWCASWVWENCRTITFYVDQTAPLPFTVLEPANNAVVPSRTEFIWNAAEDATSGVKSYVLNIDGEAHSFVDPGQCTATCSLTLSTPLSDGSHTFSVTATDGAGISTTTTPRTFTVRDTPLAALNHIPEDPVTGESVTLNAGSSSIVNGGQLFYKWDLDGDGVFEQDTGTTATADVTFSSRGLKNVGVEVSTSAGATSIMNRSITVYAAPPGNEVGVTINSGDNYTTEKLVALDVTWPRYATSVRISNDGGFLPEMTKTFDVNTPISWELDNSVAGLYTKIVYLRFEGKGVDPMRTYSDDIILDTTPPELATAKVTVVGNYVSLTTIAADAESGLATIDIGSEDGFVTNPYSNKVLVSVSKVQTASSGIRLSKSSISGLKIRITDKAGNKSGWINATKITKVTTISRREVTDAVDLALTAKLSATSRSKIRLDVVGTSRSRCLVIDNAVIGLRKGTCSIRVSVVDGRKKPITKTLNLKIV